MSIFQRDPRAGAFLGGDRVSGQDIRDQNGAFSIAILCEISLKCNLVVAAMTVANIVKSSLGPLGLDKMLVDNIGVRFVFFPWISPKKNPCGHAGSHDIK
jgi:T-complex protein 1 subunit alpha